MAPIDDADSDGSACAWSDLLKMSSRDIQMLFVYVGGPRAMISAILILIIKGRDKIIRVSDYKINFLLICQSHPHSSRASRTPLIRFRERGGGRD